MSAFDLTDEQWHKIRQLIEAGGGRIHLDWWSRYGVALAIERALAAPGRREAAKEAIELTEAVERAAEDLLTSLEVLRQRHPEQLMKLLGLSRTGYIPALEANLDEELQKLRKPLWHIRDFAEPEEDRRKLRTKAAGTRGRDIDPQLNVLARTLMGELRRRSGMPLVDNRGASSSFVISIVEEAISIAGIGYSANRRQTAQRTVKRLLNTVRRWLEPETPPASWFDDGHIDGSKSPTLN